jgi:catechol 2,3-dioxygenase-like lactoylglutathione lyase family enzyme
MNQSLGLVAIVVRDYDEALEFYVGSLGFVLVEDSVVEEQGKRWVVVCPPGARESRLLLARASTEAQASRIGDQTGGRVFLFLYTDDFWRDYEAYRGKGGGVRARAPGGGVRDRCGVRGPVRESVGPGQRR